MVDETDVAEDDYVTRHVYDELRRRLEEAERRATAAEDLAAELRDANAHLRRISQQDALTGLLNLRGIHNALRKMASACVREKWSFSVLFIDLKGFKAINDRLGHIGGDELLQQVGRILGSDGQLVSDVISALRLHDVAGRPGGDEFVILLPKQDEAGAEGLARRLRERLIAERFETSYGTVEGVTFYYVVRTIDGDALEDPIGNLYKPAAAAIGDAKD